MTSKKAKPKKKVVAKKKAVTKAAAKKAAVKKVAAKKVVAKKVPVKKKAPTPKKAPAKALAAGGGKVFAAKAAAALATVDPPSIKFLQVPGGSELRIDITRPSPKVQNPAEGAINGIPDRKWTSAEVNAGEVRVDLTSPNRYQLLVDFLFDGDATIQGEASVRKPGGGQETEPFSVTGSSGDHAQLLVSAITLKPAGGQP